MVSSAVGFDVAKISFNWLLQLACLIADLLALTLLEFPLVLHQLGC